MHADDPRKVLANRLLDPAPTACPESTNSRSVGRNFGLNSFMTRTLEFGAAPVVVDGPQA
jgi:hypothetical protein